MPTPTLTITLPLTSPVPKSPTSPIVLALSATPMGVAPGELVTFTIVLSNPGDTPLAGVVVSATLGDGLHLLPRQPGWDYQRPNHLTARLPDLLPGVGVTLTLQARATGPLERLATAFVAAMSGGETLAEASAEVWVAHPTRAQIGRDGGVLRSPDGRVRVEFPAGAVAGPLEVVYRRHAAGRGHLLRFELEAGAGITFTAPVTLTLDLTGLIDLSRLPSDHRVYLAYLADAGQGRWEEVPLTLFDPERQLIAAQVEHCSTWAAGVQESSLSVSVSSNPTGNSLDAGWRLLYVPPAVSLFSGAATYNYAIEVPPGRGGVQPTINLSYSSRAVDGTTWWVDSEWVGMGWSIDTMDIVRRGVGYAWGNQGNYEWLSVSSDFNLVLNGVSYALTPAAGVTFTGRYYAENAPQLYVELVHDDNAPNYKHDYWIVRTPDGTRYRLGYNSDSEQKLYRVYHPPYDGASKHQVYRWRVDEVVDRHNNRMLFTYHEHTTRDRDYASYLANIWYNEYGGQWASRIEFVSSVVGSDPGETPIFRTRRQLDRIRVYHLGALVREHVFTYETEVHANASIERRLTRIDQYGRNGVGGGQRLSTMKFVYQDYNNKKWELGGHQDKCNLDGSPKPGGTWTECQYWGEQFPYPRLVRVENGYGAVTRFTYSDPVFNGSKPEKYYTVVAVQTWDGVNSSPSKTTYEYVGECFNSVGQECNGPGSDSDELIGYRTTTERFYDFDGVTLLALSTYVFHTDYARLGREQQVQRKDRDGTTVLQQTDTVWSTDPLGSPTRWAHVDVITTTEYSGDVSVSTRVEYRYDINAQGGAQYGNVTTEYYYGNLSISGDERTIHRVYYPNTTAWIVNKVARETIYPGIHPTDDNQNIASRTRYRYDGAECHNGNGQHWQRPPTQGALTAVDRWAGNRGGTLDNCYDPNFDITTYGYDQWGNLTRTTDPNGNTTITYYDATHHLYPVQVCNALNQCTTTEYYGVNGVAADYGLPGQVKRVIDPNGAAT